MQFIENVCYISTPPLTSHVGKLLTLIYINALHKLGIIITPIYGAVGRIKCINHVKCLE